MPPKYGSQYNDDAMAAAAAFLAPTVDPDLGMLPDYEPTYADFLIDNASRPWDARDDAGWEHQEREDE